MIEELYYGNIDPQGCGYRSNSPVKRASDSVTNLEEELLKRLDGGDKDLFLGFCSACSELPGKSEPEIFLPGFRLGARFMMDTFMSEEAHIESFLAG